MSELTLTLNLLMDHQGKMICFQDPRQLSQIVSQMNLKQAKMDKVMSDGVSELKLSFLKELHSPA